jgi:hypothetical protein
MGIPTTPAGADAGADHRIGIAPPTRATTRRVAASGAKDLFTISSSLALFALAVR